MKSWKFPRIIRLILAIATATYALYTGTYWVLLFTAFLLFLVFINYGCPFIGTKSCRSPSDAEKPIIQQFKKYKPS